MKPSCTSLLEPVFSHCFVLLCHTSVTDETLLYIIIGACVVSLYYCIMPLLQIQPSCTSLLEPVLGEVYCLSFLSLSLSAAVVAARGERRRNHLWLRPMGNQMDPGEYHCE